MEKFQETRKKAKKNIKIADHMLTVTYPMVKDPKLLMGVVENIFLTYTNAIASVLYYERTFKRIPPFQNNFESKFRMFKEKIINKHDFDKDYVKEIGEIKNIILQHKKSPVEFKRKDRFVICSDNYKMKTVSLNDIKKKLNKAKVFIEEMDNIVSENEGLFRSTEE